MKNVFKSTMESKASQKNFNGTPQFDTNQSIKRKLKEEMLSMQKKITKKDNEQFRDFYIPSYPGTSLTPSLYDLLAEGVDNVEDINNLKVRNFLKEMKKKFKNYWNLMRFLSKEPNQILILKTRKSLRGKFKKKK